MGNVAIAQGIAEWVDGFSFESAPDEVRQAARKALINSVGTGIAAFGLPDAKVVLDLVRQEEVSGPSTILVDGGKSSAQLALFANGTMFTTLTQEETHITSGTHPSETTVPIILTVGERLHSTGRELLEALVIGIETTIAIASHELTPAVKFDNCAAPGVYGTVGAAAAAAKLMKLDRDTTANAVAMAANLAAGLSEAVKVGTSEYHFTYAQAGVNGYMAAALAKAGGVAAPTAFEGDGGFYQLFGAVPREKLHEYDSAGDVLGRLGSSWQIPEMIYKPYPIYFFNSSLVDGAKMIREKDGFSADEIESVKLTIGSLAMASGGPNFPPFRNRDSVLGASAFCVGSMLSRGSLSLKDTQDIDAPDILAIIEKTEIESDDGLMTARIDVQTSKGAFTYDGDSEGRDYRLPEPDIHQIFLEAASNTLSDEHCRELLGLLDRIEELDNVAKLVEATVPA